MEPTFTRPILMVSFVLSAAIAAAQSLAPAPVFGTGGVIDLSMLPASGGPVAKTSAMQPDGKVLVAGYDPGTMYTTMVRIDPACGALDTTFGENGKFVHWHEQRTLCHSIALQADGKIVGGGLIAPSNAGSQQRAGVFRYHPDGAVDSTFNLTGYHKVAFVGNATGQVHEVMIDEQGRIHAAAMGNARFGVFRFLPDGTLDPDYGVDGRAQFDLAYTPNLGNAAATLDDDGVVTIVGLVGPAPYHMVLARCTPTGAPDVLFGQNGMVVHPGILMETNAPGFKQMDMVRLADGRYLVSYGYYDFTTGINHPRVAAFLPNGDVDPTFGNNGIYDYTASNASGGGITVQDDGSIWLFFKYQSNDGPAAIVRLTAEGQPDATFGENGLLVAPFGNQPDYRGFNDGILLENGDVLAYGSSSGFLSIARFSTDLAANVLPVISWEFPELLVSGNGTFQWYLDGAPIADATGNTLLPTQNGTYTVVMEWAECTYTSVAYEMLSTGIAELPSADIRILGNPVEDHLVVQNDGPSVPWLLMDGSGRRLGSGVLRTGANTLDLEGFASGIHHLQCGAQGVRFLKR